MSFSWPVYTGVCVIDVPIPLKDLWNKLRDVRHRRNAAGSSFYPCAIKRKKLYCPCMIQAWEFDPMNETPLPSPIGHGDLALHETLLTTLRGWRVRVKVEGHVTCGNTRGLLLVPFLLTSRVKCSISPYSFFCYNFNYKAVRLNRETRVIRYETVCQITQSLYNLTRDV